MPYRIATYEEREDVDVDCEETFCTNNDGKNHCDSDCDIDDLDPNNPSLCLERDVLMEPGEAKEFKSIQEVSEFLEPLDEEKFSYQVIDEGSPRLLYLETSCPTGKHDTHRSFIQVSKEHQSLYDYRPNAYGSHEIVPRSQLELAL